MKTLKTILAITVLSLFSISCSKDDDSKPVKPEPVVYAEEDPLIAYLAGSGFDQKMDEFKNANSSEYGFSFKPTVNGRINSLVVKMPDVNTALKVTIWDAAAKTVIRTETISVPAANVSVEKQITPITLTKDKEYYITRNSNDYYRRYRANGSAAVYPIIAGNITITGYAYISTAEGVVTFPTNLLNTDYAGDTSFRFQRID